MMDILKEMLGDSVDQLGLSGLFGEAFGALVISHCRVTVFDVPVRFLENGSVALIPAVKEALAKQLGDVFVRGLEEDGVALTPELRKELAAEVLSTDSNSPLDDFLDALEEDCAVPNGSLRIQIPFVVENGEATLPPEQVRALTKRYGAKFVTLVQEHLGWLTERRRRELRRSRDVELEALRRKQYSAGGYSDSPLND